MNDTGYKNASAALIRALARLDLGGGSVRCAPEVFVLSQPPRCGCPRVRRWLVYVHLATGRSACGQCHRHEYPDGKWRVPPPAGSLSFVGGSSGELALSDLGTVSVVEP